MVTAAMEFCFRLILTATLSGSICLPGINIPVPDTRAKAGARGLPYGLPPACGNAFNCNAPLPGTPSHLH